MGWKLLKERFGITHHVTVTSDEVLIGSGYVHNLVSINPTTGTVTENPTFSGFLRQHYPALIDTKPDEIARLIGTADTFAASIPVYTYDGAEIIERRCEVAGWPNVTHDGDMMYENTYSTDKAVTVARAKRNASCAIEVIGDSIERAENELLKLRERHARYVADRQKLDADYPDMTAAEGT